MSLELREVVLTYADGDRRVTALDAVSLRLAPGELVYVVGPSGSGKSSLLAVSGALRTPDSGTVVVGGVETGTLSPGGRDRLRRDVIGFVFQQANLLASLTALDQLLLHAHLSGAPRRTAAARASLLLEQVGLGDKRHRRPRQLSGGERQRVGVARALMGSPQVLLLDEPTSALDAARGRDVMDLLRAVTREHAVCALMVTHDHRHLAAADRVVTLHDGRLS